MAFEVVPASVPAYPEEYQRALAAPLSMLPNLTPVQADEVRQFSLDEEEYKRLRVLLRSYVYERQQREGKTFGEKIEVLLSALGRPFSLAEVSRRGTPLGWRVSIRHEQKGIVEFQCSLAVVAALAQGSATEREEEAFCLNVLDELRAAGFIEAAG